MEQCQDPVSQRWTSVPVPYTRDDARRYLRHFIPDGWETNREWGFVVEAEDDDGVPRFAGTISLRNEGESRAEIAYGSHPWVRGRGVMERALRLLLEWGFAERDLETVIWLARRGNWASRRLAWRLGFSFDGTLRSWLHTRDGLLDAWAGTFRRGEAMAPRTTWLALRGSSATPWCCEPRGGRHPAARRGVNDPQVQSTARASASALPTTRRRRASESSASSRRCPGGTVTWTVADAETDELLGWVALFRIQAGREAEVGY